MKKNIVIRILVFMLLVEVVYAFIQQTEAKRLEKLAKQIEQKASQKLQECQARAERSEIMARESIVRLEVMSRGKFK